ncbi:Putative peptidoglycan binding domain-containing protein [Sinosporangium album]|uniref:Putative peptidoglycan binding domain-containing protein n=1 Tax=Sinosporangium album TaxID=504805 RepID=A0A1G8E1I9_9ACTN|nr:N-acetylmuramoyl-L-alanine amidase [Sinosporangium album]SDH63747.1 Putative peptidoglycan binding domain-containing protein [Sinosporangium album]
MDNLIPRRAWGARSPRGSYTTLSSTKGVKVHYTGGRVDPKIIDDHDKCVAMVKSIQKHHMDGNGWMDIGYSMVVCPHRKVFEGRGLKRVPAANGAGLNSAHYAVLGLVGSSGLVKPNDDMLHGILDAVAYLRAEGGAGREIKGHRDGYPTACPGEALYTWVKSGAPRPGSKPPANSGTAPKFPGRLLKYPPIMRGEDVRTWQRQMKKLGYTIDADGAYGAASEKVCRQFQRDQKLGVDGVVGPATWKAAWNAKESASNR